MKKPVFRRAGAVDSESASDEQTTPESADDDSAAEELNGTSYSDADTEEAEADTLKAGAKPASDKSSGGEELQRALAESKENYDKYLRTAAEFENFKKRAARDRSDLLKYAEENLARDLLEIVDNFVLALGHIPEGANDEFVKGVKMIHDRLMSILEKHSVKAESALNQLFDPNKQQALASVPTADAPPGTILEEYKKAYFLKDKLLRPGQVVVASALPDSRAGETAENTESGPDSDTGKNE